MRRHAGLPKRYVIPLFLITGLAAGAASIIAIFLGMILGPHTWWALIPAVGLFLWKGCRPWNQPRWLALAAMTAGAAMSIPLTYTTAVGFPFTAAFAFAIGGAAAFTFADTVNGIGEGSFLPVSHDIPFKKQRRAYRRRALSVYMLHTPAGPVSRPSFLLRDMNRPPNGREWTDAMVIAKALREPTARKLRSSWNELVATGRPLDVIANVIRETDKKTTIEVLLSDLPDEYLNAALTPLDDNVSSQ